MRRSLSGILRRVEQLAMTTKLGGCSGVHSRSHISYVHNDEPDPEPPRPTKNTSRRFVTTPRTGRTLLSVSERARAF